MNILCSVSMLSYTSATFRRASCSRAEPDLADQSLAAQGHVDGHRHGVGLPRRGDLGWHYLSNATCLIRPHSLCFPARRRSSRNLPHDSPLLKKTCVKQLVLDKWFPLKTARSGWAFDDIQAIARGGSTLEWPAKRKYNFRRNGVLAFKRQNGKWKT